LVGAGGVRAWLELARSLVNALPGKKGNKKRIIKENNNGEELKN
jgi:hypothetical protein